MPAAPCQTSHTRRTQSPQCCMKLWASRRTVLLTRMAQVATALLVAVFLAGWLALLHQPRHQARALDYDSPYFVEFEPRYEVCGGGGRGGPKWGPRPTATWHGLLLVMGPHACVLPARRTVVPQVINNTEVVWQAPMSPKGVLFIAHGCNHGAVDFWPKHDDCPKCIGAAAAAAAGEVGCWHRSEVHREAMLVWLAPAGGGGVFVGVSDPAHRWMDAERPLPAWLCLRPGHRPHLPLRRAARGNQRDSVRAAAGVHGDCDIERGPQVAPMLGARPQRRRQRRPRHHQREPRGPLHGCGEALSVVGVLYHHGAWVPAPCGSGFSLGVPGWVEGPLWVHGGWGGGHPPPAPGSFGGCRGAVKDCSLARPAPAACQGRAPRATTSDINSCTAAARAHTTDLPSPAGTHMPALGATVGHYLAAGS